MPTPSGAAGSESRHRPSAPEESLVLNLVMVASIVCFFAFVLRQLIISGQALEAEEAAEKKRIESKSD